MSSTRPSKAPREHCLQRLSLSAEDGSVAMRSTSAPRHLGLTSPRRSNLPTPAASEDIVRRCPSLVPREPRAPTRRSSCDPTAIADVLRSSSWMRSTSAAHAGVALEGSVAGSGSPAPSAGPPLHQKERQSASKRRGLCGNVARTRLSHGEAYPGWPAGRPLFVCERETC
jgi:hypothetical protein